MGSLFVGIGMNWYDLLTKPSEFVPNYLIPIVWSFIYVIFAIVLCLWVSNDKLPTKTIVLLILNGIFNLLWCLFFFTLNETFLGVVSIVILLILAYLLVINIYKNKKLFGYLTAIYPVWGSVATTLNLALWILN